MHIEEFAVGVAAIGGLVLPFVVIPAWRDGNHKTARMASGLFAITLGAALLIFGITAHLERHPSGFSKVQELIYPCLILGPILLTSGAGFLALRFHIVFRLGIIVGLVGTAGTTFALMGSQAVFLLLPPYALLGVLILLSPLITVLYLALCWKRENGAR